MQKNIDVQPNVNDDVHPNFHGDVKPDASQDDNKVDAYKNVVTYNNVAASQASSCVVDTSYISLSQVQAKQKNGRKLVMKMKKR